MKVNILGTPYTIEMRTEKDDIHLATVSDGYTDVTTKTIVIEAPDDTWTIGNPEAHIKAVKRHEILHAFLYESGLNENSFWGLKQDEQHPEQMVEWFAIQFPKILQAYMEADAM